MAKKLMIVGLATVMCAGSMVADSKDSKTKKSGMELIADNNLMVDAKIGIVDSYAAMGESKPGSKAREEFEQKRQSLSSELQKEEQKITQEMSEYKSKASTLSESAREKEEKKLVKREQEYKNKIQESEEELKSDMQKTTELLAKDLDQAVTSLAKEENLDVVLDRATGRAVYVSDKFDFTKKAISKIDSDYEVKLAQTKKGSAKSKEVTA